MAPPEFDLGIIIFLMALQFEGGGCWGKEKPTLCTPLRRMTIVDDPLV